MSVLVLFDIDGTLIHAAGAGIQGMALAFAELYGVTDALAGIEVAGRTDRAITISAFERHGVAPTSAAIEQFRAVYLRFLPGAMEAAANRPSFGTLPGAHDSVRRVAADPRFTTGLLTGNFEGAAETKLRYFDLWSRFRLGAFGDDHVHRSALVPVARARATALGAAIEHVAVIGDTPLDIACARDNGALAVGVASGPFDAAALATAGAHVVLPSLADLELDVLTRRPS
jgi:phosphoglycolate phosphatase-like HAD superfamily hydrolase